MPETVTEPSYEELTKSVRDMQTFVASMKDQIKQAGVANDDDKKDKEHEANFKTAMDDMEKRHKEAADEMDKKHKDMKAAFKTAMDEKDPEKKKEAMKKAMDMQDDHKKEGMKKGNDDHKEDKKDHEKMASIESELKLPIIQKILQASAAVNPAGVKALTAQLKTASLTEAKKKWDEMQPFVAALGLGTAPAPVQQSTMIPFAASAVLGNVDTIAGEPAKLHVASTDDEFANLDSEELLRGMYQ